MRDPGCTIKNLTEQLTGLLVDLPAEERIAALNEVRSALHKISPLRHHPVDCVTWVRAVDVMPATYENPNYVAPPEMKLLAYSVEHNGYTMPVVTHEADIGTVTVDGHHRRRVCLEVPAVGQSTMGYLPVTRIRAERADEPARIASTIEHNRARGEHRVDSMSDVVRLLYQAGWRDSKIQDELGMMPDEVLRLKQMTGLAELFADREFSEAWEPA